MHTQPTVLASARQISDIREKSAGRGAAHTHQHTTTTTNTHTHTPHEETGMPGAQKGSRSPQTRRKKKGRKRRKTGKGGGRKRRRKGTHRATPQQRPQAQSAPSPVVASRRARCSRPGRCPASTALRENLMHAVLRSGGDITFRTSSTSSQPRASASTICMQCY